MGLFDALILRKIKKYINSNEELRKRFDEDAVKQKRETYYREVQRFFEKGVLREIYKSDLISICNLANSYYIVFMFALIDEKSQIIGVITDTDGCKNIIKNNYMLFRYIEHYTNQNQDKYLVALNDTLIRAFEPIMKKRQETGSVSKAVDLNFEKNLIKKK